MKKQIFSAIFAATAALMGADSPANLSPDAQTVAFWDLQNGKSESIPDGSGHGCVLELKSKENAVHPKFSADGLVFDGQGGYAAIPKTDVLHLKKDFTIEIVFKAEEPFCKNGGSLIGNKSASEKQSGFELSCSTWAGKYLVFKYARNDKAVSLNGKLSKALEPGKWYCAAVSRDGDLLSLYLNGVLLAEETVSGEIDLSANRNICVGIYSAAWQRDKEGKLILNPFVGTIRTIRISHACRDLEGETSAPKVAYTKPAGSGICGVLIWERNSRKAERLLKRLKNLGETAELVDADSDLSKYEVLFVPGAKEYPVSLRFRLPGLLQAGHHVIFDGWPETAYDGKRQAPEWAELLPGVAHCVKDSAWTYKGRGQQKQATLKTTTPSALNGMILEAPGNINGRTMNKCQWRLTSNSSCGLVEYHDCIDFTPVEFCTKDGHAIGQQTAGVRHFCKFFPRATVLCADFQGTPETSLLYGPSAGEYLAFLLNTVRSELPDQPTERYCRSQFAAQEAVTKMKLEYVKALYLTRDLVFHSENNHLLGKETAASPLKTFQAMEKNVIELTARFAKLRYNRMEFAVARKEALVKDCEKMTRELEAYSKAGENTLASLLAENPGKRYVIPENGVVDIKLSFADYQPLSWGGAPGFVEYENGRHIADLGIDGSCGPNYAGHNVYRPVTDKTEEEDFHFQKVFAKYVEETGLQKFTSHELPTNLIPLELLKKYQDTPYIPDLTKGTLRPAKDASENRYARLSGAGIISSAMYSPEFEKILEFMAKRSVNQKGVHARSVTLEGMQMGGYSEYGFAKYREFLKTRYPSLAKLNEVWGTSYKTFDEIRPPLKFPVTQSEYANNYEWIEFRSKELLKFYQHVSEVYRKYDRNHPLTGCINQASPLDGIEFYELNKYFDFAGSHNTPTSSAWYQVGLARKGQHADNNEPKWVSYSAPWNRSNAEEELQLCQRYRMIYYTAQGMTQFAPFEWLHGVQRFGEKSGYLTFTGAEFKGFTDWKKKWQKMTGAVAPKDHASTGLYWSFVTKSQTRGGVVDAERSKSLFRQYFSVLDGWNVLLDDLQLPYEMVTRGKVKAGEISHLKTLIVPQASFLESEVMEKLLDFAEQGGELILEGQVGHFDPYKREDDRIFEELGLVQLPAKNGKLSDGTSVYALTDAEEVSPAFLSFEMLEPEKVQVLKRYTDNTPAAVTLPCGKGRVICTGFSLAGTTPRDLSEEFLKTSLANRLVTSSADGIRMFPWKSQNGFLYAFVLNYSGEWRTVPVKANGTIAEAYDAESGVPLNRKADTVMVPLFPAGARIIAMRIQNGGK